MDNELTKITLTFLICCDRPNRNGTVFTEESIKRAFASSSSHIPIIMQGNTIRDGEYNRIKEKK